MKVCWNGIVKNEAARIERCMQSLIDHVDGAVIYDTGSTDGTPEIIEAFFLKHGKPVSVYHGDFVNFEHARNTALDLARGWAGHEFDYILLLDADMELRAPNGWPDISGAAYQIMQKAGSLSYYNTRLVRSKSKAYYVGVTHEFLSCPEGIGTIRENDVYCIDHADGANRPDKFQRDIALLKEAMKTDPDNHRYNFYLAQSYRDAGMPNAAATYYAKRVSLGGWDEEVWNAQVNYAHALKGMDDDAGFVEALLEAHEMRPQRAEAMYDLAHYYREKGKNKLALLFARVAMNTPRPNDVLFVNDFVYAAGAKEEMSIAGFYDPAARAEGYKACDDVALGTHGYSGSTGLARSNLFHYLQHAHEIMPSFWAKEIRAQDLPDGWNALNPSVARIGKTLYCVVRTVNYEIKEDGGYAIRGEDGTVTNDNPIRTRNFLLRLSDNLKVETTEEIVAPEGDKYGLVKGWEDMRLFKHDGDICVSGAVRDQREDGWPTQWWGKLSSDTDIAIVDPKPLQRFQDCEKNWMPICGQKGSARWVYQLGKIVNEHGQLSKRECDINPEHIRGSSQVIPFRSGYLAIVHEASYKPGGGYQHRYYWHRWAFFDIDFNLVRVSKPFVFHDKQIEFCAGLCMHPDGKRLVISYGVRDCSAWLATVDANDAAEAVFA